MPDLPKMSISDVLDHVDPDRQKKKREGDGLKKLIVGVASIAALAACVYWMPWILLWSLKSIGFSQVTYDGDAWGAALILLILINTAGGAWQSRKSKQ